MSTYANPLVDYSPQMELSSDSSPAIFANKPRGAMLSEGDETELASDFLEVGSEAELEQFLGKFFHKIGHNISKWAKSFQGQQLIGIVKTIAKTALPVAGGAVGGVVGGAPGALIGSDLASIAGGILGLELEGLSPEDRDFEVSKQFVRFAAQAVANALQADPWADPEAVAYHAAVDAARRYAPGLMDITGPASAGRPDRDMDSIQGSHHFVQSLKTTKETNMTHDIDRTQVGFAQGGGQYGPPPGGPVLNEDESLQLASELMEIGSEQELDNFLEGIGNAIGGFFNSPVGQAVGGALKDAAKAILPAAGSALGSLIPIPGVGTAIGGALGSAAAGLIHEVPEEEQFEAAHTFVKLAAEAAKNAAQAPPGGDPHEIARQAVIDAAKVHAPHIVGALTSGGCGCREHEHRYYRHYGGRQHQHTGRWYRHGEHIVLVGV